MLGLRRRQVLAAVGAGRGEGTARGADQGQSHWMGRAAQGHRGTARADDGGHGIRSRQDQGQRSGPEPLRQRLRFDGPQGDKRLGRSRVGHMKDHGIRGRTPLGRVDPGHRLGVQAVCPQAVHGLRGEGHQAPCPQQGRSLCDDRILWAGNAKDPRHRVPPSAASTATRSL